MPRNPIAVSWWGQCPSKCRYLAVDSGGRMADLERFQLLRFWQSHSLAQDSYETTYSGFSRVAIRRAGVDMNAKALLQLL